MVATVIVTVVEIQGGPSTHDMGHSEAAQVTIVQLLGP